MFTEEDSSMATLMLSVMDAFAEFERSLIRERQREVIAPAKTRGAYRGRKRALAREYGLSRETVYQYLRRGQGQVPADTGEEAGLPA